jgi:hypothetical protein
MKLKEIFGSDQNAPLVELKKLLQSNCKRNAKRMVDETAPLLWRGYEIDWEQDLKTVHLQNSFDAIRYFKSEKRSKDRISRTGYNLLMRYIDLSKQWSQFPKRSRSTICSTDLRHAGSFGKAFLIIPFDNVSSFGIAPEDINLIPVTNTTQFGDVATRITGVMRLFNGIASDVVRWGKLLMLQQNNIYPAIQTEHEILKKKISRCLG